MDISKLIDFVREEIEQSEETRVDSMGVPLAEVACNPGMIVYLGDKTAKELNDPIFKQISRIWTPYRDQVPVAVAQY